MRRIIRDVRTRGISPETTLDFWKKLTAEDLYVFFEKDDFIVDTTHAYEPYVYKNILSVLLVNHIQILQELLFTLNGLLEIKPSKVPETSLLKEFVG